MSGHLTIRDRWRIISLRFDQNISPRAISRIVCCSFQTVYNILHLFNETNDVIEREGRGGRNALTTDEVCVLRRLFYRYPNETARQINSRFFRRTGRSVTYRTIRCYRVQLGFRAVHARIQPLMNQQHANNRLLFCLGHIDDDWRRVIFADEKIFEVDSSGVVYWIPYGRPRPTTFRSQVKYRIPVFGAIWYNNRSNLVFIRGRTNTLTFVEYLESALRSRRRLIRNYYFIHDRPTWAHTDTEHEWLFRNHVSCLDDYPPVSPDINAIESIWSWMNRYVQHRFPRSQKHLEELVAAAWEEIPQGVIRGYIKNVRNVCERIVANHGWESSRR